MTGDRVEYIKNWLYRANEDISVVENLAENNIKYFSSSICFHAQQVVEKFLKAFLVFHNIDFPRTHDLDYLLLECQKIDKESFDIDLKSLFDFGVSVRYPDDFFLPGINETKEYIAIAKEIKSLVEQKISF